MIKILKSEDGFSLMELAISVAVMAIVTAIVGLTAVPTALATAKKTNIRSDVTAMVIELQGFHLTNPNKEPTAFEWEQMKMRVLEDKVDTDLLYLQNMTFIKLDNHYCVEASTEINNESWTTHFYGLTGKNVEGPCPVVPGPERGALEAEPSPSN